MKLPIPVDVHDMLAETTEHMKAIVERLDTVIDLLHDVATTLKESHL